MGTTRDREDQRSDRADAWIAAPWTADPEDTADGAVTDVSDCAEPRFDDPEDSVYDSMYAAV
jgi:hypothetical protein